MLKNCNTPKEFEKTIDENRMTIVMVSAEWCKPCHIAKPIVKKILKKHNIPLIVLDGSFEPKDKPQKEYFDYMSKFKNKYGVRGYPSFIVFLNGKRKAMWSGWGDGDDFYEMIEKYIE